jgi:hypothetical protein
MTRNLKALGLALVAVFAMSAFAASAASAAEFHSEGEGTTVEASQVATHVFKTTAGEITCSTATFKGTQATKTASSITVTPTYPKGTCHIIIFGTVSAEVNMNGCEYKLYSSGSADVLCPAGKKAIVTAAGCTVEVGAQTGKKTVKYANNGSHIDITAELTGLSYNHTGFTCGTGSGTNGTYTGTTTAAGNKGKIWYE